MLRAKHKKEQEIGHKEKKKRKRKKEGQNIKQTYLLKAGFEIIGKPTKLF